MRSPLDRPPVERRRSVAGASFRAKPRSRRVRVAGLISAKTQKMNCDYSGFEGVAIEGRPAVVTVRGKVQVRDGEFVGEASRGRFLRRGTMKESGNAN